MSWEGNILRKFRNERDMTQAQFAEWLEIPRRTYEKWESGERVPPQWVISLIKFKCEKSTKGTQIGFNQMITIHIKTKMNEWEQIVDDITDAEKKKFFWEANGATASIHIYKEI